jgi:hypothetical protein
MLLQKPRALGLGFGLLAEFGAILLAIKFNWIGVQFGQS